MLSCKQHMVDQRTQKKIIKWTELNCILEAKKYESIGQWCKLSPSSYSAAKRNNILDRCTEHMNSHKNKISP